MKTKTLFTTLTLAWLLGAATTAFAQGTAFTYQGRLQSGVNPTTGTYDMTFALFNASSGGGQVGSTITDLGLQVTNGFFTVVLDFGAVYNGTAYWLQIGVRTNGALVYTALTPRQELTPAPYAVTAENLDGTVLGSQITGTLPGSLLSGTYGNVVNFNNPGDSFTGNGSGLTGVNASQLGGLSASNFWTTLGNGGTTPGPNFLGTTDDKALEFHVNNLRALRIEPDPIFGIPNIIGGSVANFINPGSIGNVIAGGGDAPGALGTNYITSAGNLNAIGGGYGNRITAGYLSVIAGGEFNAAGPNGPDPQGDRCATIGGGYSNTVIGAFATVPGGYFNTATGSYSFAAGQYAQALHPGSFVWGDDSVAAPFSSTSSNQFLIRASGGVGIGTETPLSPLDVLSENLWDVFNAGTPGDFRVGNTSLGLKVGVATGGGGAGDVRMFAFGGTSRLILGSSTNDGVLTVAGNAVGVDTITPTGAALDVEGPASLSDAVHGFTPNTDGNGVHGIASVGSVAYGVWGESASGYGVVGEGEGGTGIGVWGLSVVPSGSGVVAQGANSSSPALTINQGTLRVAGAGTNTATTAFIHVATAANSSANFTIISNTVCDGDPNAILLVTPNLAPSGLPVVYNTDPVGVWYNGSHWTIFEENNSSPPVPVGAAFNVLVIKH